MDRQVNTALAIGIVSLMSVLTLIFVLHYGEKTVRASVMDSSMPLE